MSKYAVRYPRAAAPMSPFEHRISSPEEFVGDVSHVHIAEPNIGSISWVVAFACGHDPLKAPRTPALTGSSQLARRISARLFESLVVPASSTSCDLLCYDPGLTSSPFAEFLESLELDPESDEPVLPSNVRAVEQSEFIAPELSGREVKVRVVARSAAPNTLNLTDADGYSFAED